MEWFLKETQGLSHDCRVYRMVSSCPENSGMVLGRDVDKVLPAVDPLRSTGSSVH